MSNDLSVFPRLRSTCNSGMGRRYITLKLIGRCLSLFCHLPVGDLRGLVSSVKLVMVEAPPSKDCREGLPMSGCHSLAEALTITFPCVGFDPVLAL